MSSPLPPNFLELLPPRDRAYLEKKKKEEEKEEERKKNEIIIIEISKKYNFYSDYIPRALKNWKFELYDWGFIIFGLNHYAEGCCNIEFLFVLPKYRRIGILTQYISEMKENYFIITFTTSSEAMHSFATKEKFKNFGVTRSGNEIWYIWSEKYTYDELNELLN